MAKHKRKNGNPGTNGDAVRGGNPARERGFDDDFFADTSIDLTSDAADSSDSDSDLDINALLRKYMPEFQDGDGEAPEDGSAQPAETEEPEESPQSAESGTETKKPENDPLEDMLRELLAEDGPETPAAPETAEAPAAAETAETAETTETTETAK